MHAPGMPRLQICVSPRQDRDENKLRSAGIVPN
jgi:hypothetical protein